MFYKYKILKINIILFFICFSVTKSEDMFQIIFFESEPFIKYNELCGYPIIISPTPHQFQASIDKNGQKIIIIDPYRMNPYEKYHQIFMIAHECAHHRMGHTTVEARAKRAKSRKIVRDQELSADCWAAETMERLGLGAYAQIMADRFNRSGLYSPGGGYPSGVQRSIVIQKCIESVHKNSQ